MRNSSSPAWHAECKRCLDMEVGRREQSRCEGCGGHMRGRITRSCASSVLHPSRHHNSLTVTRAWVKCLSGIPLHCCRLSQETWTTMCTQRSQLPGGGGTQHTTEQRLSRRASRLCLRRRVDGPGFAVPVCWGWGLPKLSQNRNGVSLVILRVTCDATGRTSNS